MDLPFEGCRVLEVGGGVAAAFTSRLLAGLGADVVRADVAGTRRSPGLTDDEAVYLLPGKTLVGVDDATLAELASFADILVEDGPPGSLADRGLDPEHLRAARPAAVVVSITPYGQTGPHATWLSDDLTSFASGGIMSLTGEPARSPLATGGSQALYLGGLNGFSAAAAAYYGALVHGEGDWVDISLQECQASMLELYGPASAAGEPAAVRFGNYHRAVWALYPCADGYAGVFCLERQVRSLFAAIGAPELDDVRFTDPLQRVDHDEELSAHVISWVVQHRGDELLEIGRARKIPFGKVRTPLELLESPALVERGFFDEVRTPDGDRVRIPGRPFAGLGWRGGPELTAPDDDVGAVIDRWQGRSVPS